jgi:hypothetical protein
MRKQQTLFIVCESGLDLEMQPRSSISVVLTVYFLTPHTSLADMKGELKILNSDKKQYLESVIA